VLSLVGWEYHIHDAKRPSLFLPMSSRRVVQRWMAPNQLRDITARRCRLDALPSSRFFHDVSPGQSRIQGGLLLIMDHQREYGPPVRLYRPTGRLLSTSGSPPSKELPTPLSFDGLKQEVIRLVRQDPSPHQAQVVLDQLHQQKVTLEDGTKGGDLSSIETSVIDSWLKYQTRLMNEIEQSKIVQRPLENGVENDDTSAALGRKEYQREQEIRLREVYGAAECVNRIVDAMGSPTSHHYVAMLRSWANTCESAYVSGRTKLDIIIGIPQRAQLLLRLQDAPTVESYNQVIKAWAYSSEYLRGTMAEQLFNQIKSPNGESFHMIIRAHAWSNESRAAFHATGHFMRMMRLLEVGRHDMEPPSMEEYHILCEAWTRAGDKTAPSKVSSVLEIMNSAYEKNLTYLRPDLQCYRDALITISRRHNIIEVGDLADDTLREMKSQMVYPDTECYRATILAWKHVAMIRDNPDPEQAVRRAQDVLEEMAEAYYRTTQVTVRPTTEDYNNVLQSLALSKSPKAIDHAKKLFKKLHFPTSMLRVEPDAETYRLMLDIWRNSKSPDKLSHGIELLEEFKGKLDHDSTLMAPSASCESVVAVFNSFIRLCGATSSSKKDVFQRSKIMNTALLSVEAMKALNLEPNCETYTALVEACDHLLPSSDSPERQQVLENVFQRACEEGFVNQGLLEQLKLAASTYLFTKLVVARSVQVEDIKVLPDSWTRNVKGFNEGKKVMPLSIHGTFTFTKAAAEFRMRKLRSRTNQRLLQGGRIK
jgi:hypothetical protein